MVMVMVVVIPYCCNKKATRAPPIMAVYLGIYCDTYFLQAVARLVGFGVILVVTVSMPVSMPVRMKMRIA